MTLKHGLYRATFSTAFGQGTGVAMLNGGRIDGGDSAFAYSGEYAEQGDKFTGKVRIFRHSDGQGMLAALGTDDAIVEIVGVVKGNHIEGTGDVSGLRVALDLLQAA